MCNQRTTPGSQAGWLGWCYLYLSKSKTGSLLIISAPTYPGCLWHNIMHFSHSIKNRVEKHRRQHHSILILLVIINKGPLATMLTRATILKCDRISWSHILPSLNQVYMCIFQCMGHDEQTVVAFSDPQRINFSNELKLLCRSKLSSIIISDFLLEVLSYIHKHLCI